MASLTLGMTRPATVSPLTNGPPARAVLVMSPRAFIVIWWLVLGLHAVFIVYSAGVIKLHCYFIANNLQVTIDFMGPTVFGFFDAVVTAHYVLIVSHAAAMAQSLWWSLYHRQWRFMGNWMQIDSRTATRTIRSIRVSGINGTDSITEATTQPSSTVRITTRLYQRVIEVGRKLGLAIFGRDGLLSVEGTHYESAFFAMEVVEIALQSFQAYKLSLLVPRVWINRLNAVVLILNCWSTALVHQFLHRDRLAKRVVLLVVDGIFDIVSSMVIPLVIIYPYYKEFDLAWHDFPLVDYYNDVWLIQAISENRQIFVTSWLDYISKLTPGVTVFGGMLVLKQYVIMDCTVRAKKSSVRTASIAPCVPVNAQFPLDRDIDSATRKSDAAVSTLNEKGGKMSSRLTCGHRIQMTWHHLLLVLTGFAILAIHIHSTTVAVLSQTRGCLLEVRPWFATSYTCIALEINCAHGEFDDGADVAALEERGRAVLPSALRSLIFASCARLHVPPMIQSFSGLQMIKIYNSTVVQWDDTAELREDLHSDLQLLYFSDSNFSGDGDMPRGLLSANFPPTLTDIEFSGTNIKHFPPDLHEKWTTMQFFVLERDPSLVSIPETVLKMKIPQLYLGSNGITAFPYGSLADQAFWTLNLNGNPLQALPDTMGDLSSFYSVEAADTNVSALPLWATAGQLPNILGFSPQGYAEVFASGTPLCDDPAKRQNANDTKQEWVHLNCYRLTANHIYPIDEERQWRAASLAKMV